MPKMPCRSCPVCDATKRTLIHHQRFVDGPLGDGYDVVVCDECGCGFANGIPSQAVLDSYYAEQSKYTYDQRGGLESIWDFKRFETTLAHLLPYLGSRDAKILDVGCATGGLLSVFKRAGFNNVFGLDPSARCADSARRLHGVIATDGRLLDLVARTDRFDLILMLGVIEHVREAREALGTAKSLLRSGGMLYCAVPDVEGLVDCPNAPYQQFSTEHINFFSSVSLNNLMAKCGMAPVRNWNWKTEWSEGVMEPIASGLFVPFPTAETYFNAGTQLALKAYIEDSARNDSGLVAAIDTLTESQEAVIIWGAGTLARRLLATSSFSAMNIVAFVDSNPKLQGTLLARRPILAPTEMAKHGEPILICSGPFCNEILQTINALKIPNRIIPFCNQLAD
jgi:SAM-dependent methyltransferase